MSIDMAVAVSEKIGAPSYDSRWKSYPKYKDSGIKWLGKIPVSWGIKPFKHVTSRIDVGIAEAATHAYADNGIPIIRSKNVKPNQLTIDDILHIEKLFAEKNRSKYLLAGDIVTVRTGNAGISAVIPSSLDKSQCFTLLISTPRPNQIAQFYCYYLNAHPAQFVFNIEGWGTAQMNISVPILQNMVIVEPPFEDQYTIVSFLDRETAHIDTLISKKERIITLLQEKRVALISHTVTKGLDPDVPMKDSGVEWMGEIPEGWKLRKLKHVAKINLSNVDKKIKEDEDSVKLCNYVDVYKNDYINSDINFMESTASPNQIDKFELREGDVLITKDSESWEDIAVPAYIPSDFEDVICGYHLAIIRPDQAVVNGEYIFRSFSSNCLNYQFKVEANGITRFGIGKYPIDNSLFIVPPINEQKSIASFLNNKTIKIDCLILKIREAIEKLHEYRTALISAAVTGKIDVRNGVE